MGILDLLVCDCCKEKVTKVFEVQGVKGEYCTDCQLEVESDMLDDTSYLSEDWD